MDPDEQTTEEHVDSDGDWIAEQVELITLEDGFGFGD